MKALIVKTIWSHFTTIITRINALHSGKGITLLTEWQTGEGATTYAQNRECLCGRGNIYKREKWWRKRVTDHVCSCRHVKCLRCGADWAISHTPRLVKLFVSIVSFFVKAKFACKHAMKRTKESSSGIYRLEFTWSFSLDGASLVSAPRALATSKRERNLRRRLPVCMRCVSDVLGRCRPVWTVKAIHANKARTLHCKWSTCVWFSSLEWFWSDKKCVGAICALTSFAFPALQRDSLFSYFKDVVSKSLYLIRGRECAFRRHWTWWRISGYEKVEPNMAMPKNVRVKGLGEWLQKAFHAQA